VTKQLLTIFVSGLTLLITVIVLLPEATVAQPPTPNVKDLREDWWIGNLPPIVGSVPAGDKTASVTALTGLADWSRIAFQSYRDGNWEIYLARGDGSQPVRLTNHSAADVRPRLNRGAARLVFTSDRDGNFEVYTMNADGSGLARLTFNDASEAGPVWSPDGGRIVFASDRDGNAEIYMMNADGSDQTRLTHDGAVDLMPTWSPDGNQIAWVRRDGIEGALWVMNADGSNSHALTGTLRFPQNPAWSPDGTRIAFDYDADGDVWNELVLINADGTGLHTVYDPGANLVDAWMGSWSPDGGWLSFSRVEYVVQNDELYLRNIYVEKVPPGVAYSDRVTDLGVDGLPDWQTTDISPPRSRLHTLPRYLRSHDGVIKLTLEIEDAGGSEIESYDIQMRDGLSGQWMDMQHASASGPSWLQDVFYEGALGHTYSFRVRARDHAFNQEDWPASSDASTTLYAWRISGEIRDTRDVPLPKVTLDVHPRPFSGNSTDVQGRYALYSAATEDHQVRAVHPNYASPPATAFSVADDVQGFNLYLRPADDVIANGDFENGNLSGWEATGAFTPTLTSIHHTGQAGLVLGQPLAMNPPLELPEETQGTGRPGCLVIDSRGTLHTVYPVIVPSGTALAYVSKPLDGPLSDAVYLTDAGGGDSGLAVDSADTLYTVRSIYLDDEQRFTLTYRYKPVDGEWSPAARIPDVRANLNSTPHLATDSHDGLHLVWDCQECGSQVYYITRTADGEWMTPMTLPAEPVFYFFRPMDVVMTGDDVLHVVWYETGESDPSNGRLVYLRKPPGGSWSPRMTLATSSAEDQVIGSPGSPTLVADSSGRLYLFWMSSQNGQTISFRQSADGGQTWSEPVRLPIWNANLGTVPVIQVDAGGRIHALWTRQNPDYTRSIVYTSSVDHGATWSKPLTVGLLRVGLGYDLATGVIDSAHNRLYVSGEGFIAELPQLNEVTGDHLMKQRVSIPETMHAPTLSFVYRLNKDMDSEEDQLKVSIDGEPVWVATDHSEEWTHAWVDVGTWRGDAIELTLSLHSEAGGARTWAYLDEVTLGPWLTPAIESVFPPHIEAQARIPISLTITGDNFIETPTVRLNETMLQDVQWVNERTLQVTLPADLAPGIYDVWVTNPAGQESALPRGLRVGKQVYLPAVFRQYAP
jgi:Tol biopolymer transport system component